jgi:hypothetical protein
LLMRHVAAMLIARDAADFAYAALLPPCAAAPAPRAAAIAAIRRLLIDMILRHARRCYALR